MYGIAEFIVKVADLVEAEGRSARSVLRAEAREFRESAATFAMSLALVLAGAVLGLAGIGFWLAAIYLAVSEAASPAWGACVAGVVGVGTGAGCIWIFRKTTSA